MRFSLNTLFVAVTILCGIFATVKVDNIKIEVLGFRHEWYPVPISEPEYNPPDPTFVQSGPRSMLAYQDGVD